jgi:L,D-peptidoglycan transpeptidase YkuD (ErfK/YbiS/YcfS/YnhG family)
MKSTPKKHRELPGMELRQIRRGVMRVAVARRITSAPPGKFRGPPTWRLHIGPLVVPCALGSGGLKRAKREGDHASPTGTFALLFGYYRPDRQRRLRAHVPLKPLRPGLGWCDDSASPAYNRPVATSCPWSHERLWRDDDLYDVVIVLDYNYHPRRKGRGSAIFLHCARPDLTPTEGCIALRIDDLRRLLPRLALDVVLTVR